MLCIAVVIVVTTPAEAAVPIVNQVLPRGAQRGTELELVIAGQRLADVEAIMWDRAGIEVLEVDAQDTNRLQVRVRVSEDASLGPHAMRVRTASGVSNLRTFSVGALTETREAEPNDTTAAANLVELDTTINGVAQNEDLDIFAFDALEGERVTAEVEGIRLGGFLFDPYVAIYDSNGFALASSDDAPLVRQDGVVTVTIPADGRYFVQLRESSYAGNGNCFYRLHLGRFPRPTATLPLGGKPGETLDIALLGGGMTGERTAITLPQTVDLAESPGGWRPAGVVGINVSDPDGTAPSPNFFRINVLDNAFEAEPNNRHDTATVFTGQCALNGVLQESDDQDCFRFNAGQGERFIIAVFARQLRTPVDAVLRIHRLNGRQVAANDDTLGSDPLIDFIAPEAGEYVVTIHDHLRRGGEDFAYRIEVWNEVAVATAQLPRNAEFVTVPAGNRMATILTIGRFNESAEIDVVFPELPDGVNAVSSTWPNGVAALPVVFEAGEAAVPQGTLTRVTRADDTAAPGHLVSMYQQDIELALGQNRTVYMAQSVDRFPVVVAEPVAFQIEVAEPRAPLVRNGSMQLRVTATREEGFTGPIRLRVPFRPPGVGASDSITIAENESDALIPVNANANAQMREWPMVVIAEANTPRGFARTSSQLFHIEVAAPLLAFQPQAVTVEQGQTTSMAFTIQRLGAFEGDVRVALQALPHQTTAEDVVVGPDAENFQFVVATSAESPPGRHRNLFCAATVTVNGEPVVHRLAAGELRIDKPLPPEIAQPAPEPPPPASEETAARPLTRLEKLRRDKQTREEQRNREGGQTDDE